MVIELKRDATAGSGAEPTVPFHAAADAFWLQHAGAERRQPEQLDLRGFLTSFVAFREEVVARRTAFDLTQGAGTGAYPVRSGCCGFERGRSRSDHSRFRRSCRSARKADDAALACAGYCADISN